MKYKIAILVLMGATALSCNGMQVRQRKKPQVCRQKDWASLPAITKYDQAKANALEVAKREEASFANQTTNFLCCITFAVTALVYVQSMNK